MATVTVTERNVRFDELKLSARVFFANKPAVAGLVIFLLFIGDALIVQIAPGVLGVQYPNDVVPPQFTQTNPECVGAAPEPPSVGHLFGTIQYGLSGIGCLDLLQLVMKAIRVDIAISFFIVFVGATIGTLIGVVSGYAGKWLDEAMMRITDVFFSVPFLILALAVGFVIGRTLLNMALALIIIWWPLIVPGAVITLFALAVNLMGDGLRDVIDPRRRS